MVMTHSLSRTIGRVCSVTDILRRLIVDSPAYLPIIEDIEQVVHYGTICLKGLTAMHGIHHRHSHAEAPVTRGSTIRWAHQYDLFVRPMTLGREERLRRGTIQLASIPRNAAVLDVGCGTGTLTLLAKAEAGDAGVVCGIDASPEMIAVAQEKALQQNRRGLSDRSD
ncbi:MAG: methyltransferase domain-containing protein [Chloroflexi bacterium]|nr:methyltransferase domain-containing protein [Chloroflexota bacterium]